MVSLCQSFPGARCRIHLSEPGYPLVAEPLFQMANPADTFVDIEAELVLATSMASHLVRSQGQPTHATFAAARSCVDPADQSGSRGTAQDERPGVARGRSGERNTSVVHRINSEAGHAGQQRLSASDAAARSEWLGPATGTLIDAQSRSQHDGVMPTPGVGTGRLSQMIVSRMLESDDEGEDVEDRAYGRTVLRNGKSFLESDDEDS